MRAELERWVPGVLVLAGAAERIPLTDGFVDAVTVASAFHWFDADEQRVRALARDAERPIRLSYMTELYLGVAS